jgi:hypothetical protein
MAKPKVTEKKPSLVLAEILASDAAAVATSAVLPESYLDGVAWAAAWNSVYFAELDRLKYENGLWPPRMPYPKPADWGDVWGTLL